MIKTAEVVLCVSVALFRSFAGPLHCLSIISREILPAVVAPAQVVLRRGIPARGASLPLLQRNRRVCWTLNSRLRCPRLLKRKRVGRRRNEFLLAVSLAGSGRCIGHFRDRRGSGFRLAVCVPAAGRRLNGLIKGDSLEFLLIIGNTASGLSRGVCRLPQRQGDCRQANRQQCQQCQRKTSNATRAIHHAILPSKDAVFQRENAL